jgi:hypothetical protein
LPRGVYPERRFFDKLRMNGGKRFIPLPLTPSRQGRENERFFAEFILSEILQSLRSFRMT